MAMADDDSPVVPARRVPRRHRAAARRAEDHRGVPQRPRRRLARARRRPVRRHRALLPPRLQRQPGAGVAAGARRRRRQAAARRQGRRRRLRPRRFDDPDGAGVPALAVLRLRLPRRRRSSGRGARRTKAGVADRARFEVASAKEFPGVGYDLVTLLRLPARHGRPGRRRAARPASRSTHDGTWMLVEPFAGDSRRRTTSTRSAASSTAPRPWSARRRRSRRRSGLALGAQAGEARLGEVAREAGFRASAAPPRRRSTWCSRRAPDELASQGRRRDAEPLELSQRERRIALLLQVAPGDFADTA